MGIEPEKASPLVTNGRGTELGTRLLSGLAAPLRLRSTSAADTCRMPQDRPECQVPPRTGPPRGSFAFEELAQNGVRRETVPDPLGGGAAPFALLRNSRKTECGAKRFLTRLEVRAARFAL